MIRTFRDLYRGRKKTPRQFQDYVAYMRLELEECWRHWNDDKTSGDCKRVYPEFARGYMTAVREILGCEIESK